MNVKEIAVKAAKTFVQAFLSAVTVTMVTGGDLAAVKAGAIAAGAAALSVVWNALLQWSNSE